MAAKIVQYSSLKICKETTIKLNVAVMWNYNQNNIDNKPLNNPFNHNKCTKTV